jgi:hypothetical protein
VKIGHDMVGGSAAFAGAIGSAERVTSVTIGGSLYAGSTPGGSAEIGAGDDIGSISIGGSVVGTASSPVLIGARGQASPTATQDLALGSIKVKGSLAYASIGAGYDASTFTPVNGSAQIGSVSIGGDWIASNLAAGAAAGPDGLAGTPDDIHIAGGGTASAKIASIVIKGRALGTLAAGDHFGIVAQQVGSLKIGAVTVPLAAGPSNDLAGFAIGPTGDFVVREV